MPPPHLHLTNIIKEMCKPSFNRFNVLPGIEITVEVNNMHGTKRAWEHSLALQSSISTNHSISWTDETKVELFGHNVHPCTCWKKQTKHSILVLNTTCQHSGGQLMICACFAAMRPGHLSLFGVQRSSWLAQSILEAILRPSNWQQKLGPNWVMQKDNEPKYTCKSTKQKMAEKEKN